MKMRPSWMPSLGDLLFLLLLQLIFGYLPNYMLADGSTGWHLLNGHYIINHWQLPPQDLVSYTFADKPWLAYEWLFDVCLAALDNLGGLSLVTFVCGASVALLFLLLYQACRKAGCHFLLTIFLCLLGIIVSAVHWLVRPHLVTFFGVFFYAAWLDAFCQGKLTAKQLWWRLGLSMLIWVNCHPAFIAGLAIIGIYLVCRIVISKKQTIELAFGLGIAALATLFNPYGVRLYEYIAQYFQQSIVLANTEEYKSPVFHGDWQTTSLELLYFLLLFGLFLKIGRKINVPRLFLVLALAHLSLSSVRNMPLFAIVALPFIAELFAGLSLESAPSWCRGAYKLWQETGTNIDRIEASCTRHLLPILAVLILAVSCLSKGKAFGFELITSKFDAANKPTATLDCLSKLPENKGFNFDNWGGYIAYKTGRRVFIDDRVDFYGEKFYLDYAAVATLQPNWQRVLDRYHIKWILFPKQSALVARLKDQPGWKLFCQDQASALYIRD
ncbi:MAG: hypothetical protein K2W82_01310 [Candidatus Obscuribacterales bacterium]|nr:hypothetical protein [Candidatus Obscuribacterales bacterium]